MALSNARYADAAGTSILADTDGMAVSIPVDPRNSDYARILAEAIPVAAWAEPFATVAAIKTEAARRINAAHPEWKQRNSTARGTELVRIRLDRAWSPEEQTEADTIQAVWDWVKSVRAASDAIEADASTLTLSAMRADPRWPA